MNKKEFNKKLSILKDLYKNSKKSRLDTKRLNYYIIECLNNELGYEDLIKGVMGYKFFGKLNKAKLICRITEQKIHPILTYNSSISYSASKEQFKDIYNVAQVDMKVENSNWFKNVAKYNSFAKTIKAENIPNLAKTFMLLEQVGIEENVVNMSRNYVGKLSAKERVKVDFKKLIGFHNDKFETEDKLRYAEISLFGGQQKYNELKRVLSGEVPFDKNAKDVLNNAIATYKSYLELISYFNGNVNIQVVGDAGKYNFKILNRGELVYRERTNGIDNMSSVVNDFNHQLECGIVKEIYGCRARNHIYMSTEEPEEEHIEEPMEGPEVHDAGEELGD